MTNENKHAPGDIDNAISQGEEGHSSLQSYDLVFESRGNKDRWHRALSMIRDGLAECRGLYPQATNLEGENDD